MVWRCYSTTAKALKGRDDPIEGSREEGSQVERGTPKGGLGQVC